MIVDEQELQEKKFKTQESQTETKIKKTTLEETFKEKKKILENLEKVVQQGTNLKERIVLRKKDQSKNEKDKSTLEEELKIIDSDLAKEHELLQKLKIIEQIEKTLEGSTKILGEITTKEKERDSYTKFIANKEKTLQAELEQLKKSKDLITKQLEYWEK